MNKKFINIFLVAIALLILTSCGTVRGIAEGLGVAKRPLDEITSETEVGLVLADQTIEYTIDYSTQDGRLILNKMSEHDAKEYVTSAALIKYNCDVIFRPKYNILKKGRQILRITMGGRPANYKNTLNNQTPTAGSITRNNNSNINIHVNN